MNASIGFGEERISGKHLNSENFFFRDLEMRGDSFRCLKRLSAFSAPKGCVLLVENE